MDFLVSDFQTGFVVESRIWLFVMPSIRLSAVYEGEEELIAFFQMPLCRQTLKTTKNSKYRRFCNAGELTVTTNQCYSSFILF